METRTSCDHSSFADLDSYVCKCGSAFCAASQRRARRCNTCNANVKPQCRGSRGGSPKLALLYCCAQCNAHQSVLGAKETDKHECPSCYHINTMSRIAPPSVGAAWVAASHRQFRNRCAAEAAAAEESDRDARRQAIMRPVQEIAKLSGQKFWDALAKYRRENNFVWMMYSHEFFAIVNAKEDIADDGGPCYRLADADARHEDACRSAELTGQIGKRECSFCNTWKNQEEVRPIDCVVKLEIHAASACAACRRMYPLNYRSRMCAECRQFM